VEASPSPLRRGETSWGASTTPSGPAGLVGGLVHTHGWMRPDGSNLGGVMGELVPPFIVEVCTDLGLILRARGIDTVIISGIATNHLLRDHRPRGGAARLPRAVPV